jgi:CheY-like chemotaxis protein
MLAYSGRGKFVIENINLSKVVEDMTELLKISIGKNVTIKYQLDHNLPQVEADATQIRQVAMNLIINAADAIGEKPGVITVTTGLMECDSECLMDTVIGKEDLQTGTHVYLEVSDNGCGMDEKTLARIFDPFFTTKFTGRGLGLAAVLGIVRGHKGALKVSSKPGEGTIFRVVLPKSDKHIEASPIANKQADDLRGRGTILVVDDEVDILTITRMMLEKKGFSVLTASNGAAGVDLFRKHSDEIMAVLLDMTMPNMNGEEAFREMQKIRSDVLAVLVSGYNEEEIRARFSGESFAGFLHKPYGFPDLMNKLKEILP